MINTVCAPKYLTESLSETTDGDYIATLIETVCRTTKTSYAGKAGELIRLRPWQRQIINELFETDANGNRRYRRGLLGLPKKNGKSLLGSSLGIASLLEGDDGSEVYAVAASRDQARIVFNEAKKMVQADPELREMCTLFRDAIEFNSSIYRVLSADADLQDGLNPTLCIMDEVHRQPNRELWEIMSNAIGTRPNAMVLGITTAGFDRHSICYELYEHGKRVATKEVDDKSFYFRWYEPTDLDSAVDDPDVWKQCNPALGDFLAEADFADSVKSTAESSFRRYRLNQWTQTHSAWLKAGVWEELTNLDKTLEDQPVVLGFDGSWSNDSTALVGVGLNDKHIAVIKSWEKPSTETGDWRVDVSDVENEIRKTVEELDVVAIACDPSGWKHSLAQLETEGLPMLEFPNSPARMIAAVKTFENAVYEGKLTHDGNGALARHIANARVKDDRRSGGYYITKESKTSPRKIDLAIASLMAFEIANDPNIKPAKVAKTRLITI